MTEQHINAHHNKSHQEAVAEQHRDRSFVQRDARCQEAESPEEVAEEGCECGFLVGLDVHTVAYLCSTCTDTFFPLKPMPKSVILRIPWYSMSV